MLLLYAIGIGLLLGRVAGGRISALADIHIRWWGLAVGGLLFQVALFGPLASRVGDAGPLLYVASSALVFLAMLRNLALPGFPMLALGAALNMLVVVANGGLMPSSPQAWEALNGLVPELRIDPLSGLRAIVAGSRAERPGAAFAVEPAAPLDPAADPFLEGHEDQTPPEVWALRPRGGGPDGPGWLVRAMPNLYPALGPPGAANSTSVRSSG